MCRGCGHPVATVHLRQGIFTTQAGFVFYLVIFKPLCLVLAFNMAHLSPYGLSSMTPLQISVQCANYYSMIFVSVLFEVFFNQIK